jgi:hypothetical protein
LQQFFVSARDGEREKYAASNQRKKRRINPFGGNILPTQRFPLPDIAPAGAGVNSIFVPFCGVMLFLCLFLFWS